ncbi:MAG: type IX secretion system membrane protein PorP/SprF [Bacteroidales bacterium]
MSAIKKSFLLLPLLILSITAFGQQMPFNPISYRIFTPFLLNPAIAGSKDFLSADFGAGFRGKSNSQILSANGRVARKVSEYVASGKTYSFTNIGIGGSVFNDLNTDSLTHSAGAGITGAYHFPLDNRGLSYLALGASFKGLYNYYEGNTEREIPPKEFYFPEIDLGIYLYNPDFYAGISATNLINPPVDTSTVSIYRVPVSRQYNFIGGYKLVISRALKLVLEPSLIISTDDSLSFNIRKNVQPIIRLYAGNFCIGTYFNNSNKVSFFFQYRYPKFYVGAFVALPKNSPFYKSPITTELAAGINLTRSKSGSSNTGHW